ncbi:MAG: hypothetical protein H7Y27_00680 [Gemmatimonadaceae bacterium]|nr:hypothetical protein [Chitinophagaceae bacterium]
MFRRIFSRRQQQLGSLFNGHFIDIKALYVMEFDSIPTISFVGELDGGKAFDFIHATYRHTAVKMYQHNYFDYEEDKMFSNNTIYVLRDKKIIEVSHNYCQLLYDQSDYSFGIKMGRKLSEFRMTVAPREESVIGFVRPSKN